MNQKDIHNSEMICRLQSVLGGRFPNTFVVGTPKSGTTSLFRYLDFNKEVFTPSIKEPSFFSDLKEANSKISWFDKLYSNANEPIRLNGTSINFYGSDNLPSLLKRVNPNIKIIILLRNPVDRFYSFYRFLKHMNYKGAEIGIDDFINNILSNLEKDDSMENKDFHIDGKRYKESTLIGGKYAAHLSNWINHFDENLKIGFFDDLKSQPKEFMGQISEYLDIENVWENFKFEVENQTITPKCRGIHNMSITLYSKFSTLLNKHKHLKRTLLNGYKKLNASTEQNKFSDSVSLILKNYYQKDINETREIVLKHSNFCVELPSWLSPIEP